MTANNSFEPTDTDMAMLDHVIDVVRAIEAEATELPALRERDPAAAVALFLRLTEDHAEWKKVAAEFWLAMARRREAAEA